MTNAKRIPVYSADDSLLGWYTEEQAERLCQTQRANVIRARSGVLRRVYLLDSSRALAATDYVGQRYSHCAESNHPNPLYQNIRGVWAFRYISPKDRGRFTAVMESVMAGAAC